jgi:hypothetical protein
MSNVSWGLSDKCRKVAHSFGVFSIPGVSGDIYVWSPMMSRNQGGKGPCNALNLQIKAAPGVNPLSAM